MDIIRKIKKGLRGGWGVCLRYIQRTIMVFKKYPAQEIWVPPADASGPTIVTSAARIEGPFYIEGREYPRFIIVSSRHWDDLARIQYMALKQALLCGRIRTTNPDHDYGLRSVHAEQGFIDQYRRFYNREDAYQVVKENNQELRGQLDFESDDELYSEHLY